MKHLTILVPKGASDLATMASILGTYKIFIRANDYYSDRYGRPVFRIQVAGSSDTVEVHDGLFSVKPQLNIEEIKRTDLIIIPSLAHNYDQVIAENEAMTNWIEKRYKDGAEIASICTGAFLLASSGLIEGMSCSTHWTAADTFRQKFPKVKMRQDELITDEKGIYTNGGAYSFLNLIIYLVEKHYGRETAIYCSKIFQVELDRQSQSAFSIFTGQKTHGDEMVKEAQSFIESRLHEKISVEELSLKFAVGRRNFDRRFIKATGNTPVEYLQRAKMEWAKKAFETTRKNINEVMYEVGYSDQKAFREVFRKFTGLSPLEYRNRYNNKATV